MNVPFRGTKTGFGPALGAQAPPREVLLQGPRTLGKSIASARVGVRVRKRRERGFGRAPDLGEASRAGPRNPRAAALVSAAHARTREGHSGVRR